MQHGRGPGKGRVRHAGSKVENSCGCCRPDRPALLWDGGNSRETGHEKSYPFDVTGSGSLKMPTEIFKENIDK